MKINISARNYEVKDMLKELIKEKVGRLDKLVNENSVASVECERSKKDLLSLKLSINNNGKVFMSELDGDNMYKLLDEVVDNVKTQLRRSNDKQIGKDRKARGTIRSYGDVAAAIEAEDGDIND